MPIRTERIYGPALLGCICVLVMLLSLGGCQTPKSNHRVSTETRNANGFTITQAGRIGIGLRSDFDAANRAIAKKDFQRGIELLEEITMASPELSAAHINLAIAYQGVDDLEHAEASLLRALETNPRHPVPHNELGIVYRRTGRFTMARKSYERALSLQPRFHFARKNLAILCDLFLSDTGCALEHYALYLEAVPEDEMAEIWIADLESRVGRGEN